MKAPRYVALEIGPKGGAWQIYANRGGTVCGRRAGGVRLMFRTKEQAEAFIQGMEWQEDHQGDE